MDKTQDPILNALQQAGEPIGITDEMVELDEDRITSDTEVSEEVFRASRVATLPPWQDRQRAARRF